MQKHAPATPRSSSTGPFSLLRGPQTTLLESQASLVSTYLIIIPLDWPSCSLNVVSKYALVLRAGFSLQWVMCGLLLPPPIRSTARTQTWRMGPCSKQVRGSWWAVGEVEGMPRSRLGRVALCPSVKTPSSPVVLPCQWCRLGGLRVHYPWMD